MNDSPALVDIQVQKFLGAYSSAAQAQARTLITSDQLGAHLQRKYAQRHAIQTDGALYGYVMQLKQAYLRSSAPLHKVTWQNKLDLMKNVLGLNTAISRAQGGRLKAKSEIRIASLFKQLDPAFLHMVVVHELAHLRERNHDKAFYQLCVYMLPDYHQIEFDLRLYLLHQSLALPARLTHEA